MSGNTNIYSIKNLFITVVMAITAFALAVASAISLYLQINNYKKELVQDVRTYSELISINATNSIIAEDSFKEEENLKALAVNDEIFNVHIYNLDTDGSPMFFSSFNKPGIAPVVPQLSRIEELSEPKLEDDFMEIIWPIRQSGALIGYTYIRYSAQGLVDLITQAIAITLTVTIIALAVCFFLILKLQKTLTKPIDSLINIVQRVSRQRDYSLRADASNLREFSLLAESFNELLSRTHEYMLGQNAAEEEQRKLQASLEEKVNQRTVALKEANQELIQTLEKLHQFQRQLVQNEKMASLGDMVAGVAHEVNTPIGLGVTASTMMLDRLEQLTKEFESKTLKASSLEKFIGEGKENLNIIYRNLNRAAELISSFKQVAVDQSSETSRVFSFGQLMDEILLSLRPKLKKEKHHINVKCDSDLYIESKAGPINQIMINLIMNSVIHGFEFMDSGEIDIDVSLIDDNKLKLIYKDNGKGIPEHLRKRIFDPFVTTKRGQGGSGLGMHLVYNLVTQALNGSISINSQEGSGVEFQIIFPVKRLDAESAVKRG
ncbi:ATP-binding protein [Aestuariibacter sp. AA17]|uniref:histidine kinase n=1 Tax=Fluctibacter corallii TaxID=2984329 RepID=A0ABT3ABU2_9ALTE|nr:HAMP domain-containing sensor histidine kinase [Aestuariibacter sp. AA17]MCV2885751.1 ATP-binding protein [Aestuariibacter sp. AA17]